MASTYSSNLRLELIGTGEQQGTWGSTTNTNLGTLLEQAIGGYESVTVSGAGDTTLTTANGSADQARNMTLNLVGTPGAIRSVICPSAEKIYIVKNATTGGFSITFKVTGQTGVSIPNGSTVIVYVDGTDARLVSQFPVPVTQGGTGATASTGTGSVVLSASPTFTGVPLSTTAAVDTNTTQIATTAYVVGQGYAKLASPSLTGTPLSTTAAANTSTTQIATTAFVIGQANGTAGTIAMNGTQAAGSSALYARADHVHPSDTSRAPLASPSLTGTPLSTTAAADTNTTQIATTAYVVGQASAVSPLVNGTVAVGTSLRYARADHVHPIDTSRAPLASPAFTGTPSLPTGTTAVTQSPGNNTTAVATTAFVTASSVCTTTTYTSGSGNYTIPTGTTFVYVRLWAAGGSGSTAVSSSSAGGGGGAYKEYVYAASALGGAGANVAYAVGAGGAASAASTGNPGGNSSFGSLIAYGGGGATGTGGASGTGGAVFNAGTGSDSGFGGTAANGANASDQWGGAQGGGGNTIPGGRSLYGGGGGGGRGNATATAGGASYYGGAGGTCTAGAAGNAGAARGGGGSGAGSNGANSGAGGAGRIEIWTW